MMGNNVSMLAFDPPPSLDGVSFLSMGPSSNSQEIQIASPEKP